MRSDEYSEWDEYFGLDTIKRVIVNAVEKMSSAVSLMMKKDVEKTLFNAGEHLDLAKVALLAVLWELDKCKMVGTEIKKGERG